MNKLIPLFAIPCALALILFSCNEAEARDVIESDDCGTVFGETYKFNGEGVK